MNESEQTRKWCNELKKRGTKVLALTPEGLQEPGWPDRLIWDTTSRLGHMLIECKRYDNKESAMQTKNLQDLRVRGYIALTLRYTDEHAIFEAGGRQIGHANKAEFFKDPLEVLLQIKKLYENLCVELATKDPAIYETKKMSW